MTALLWQSRQTSPAYHDCCIHVGYITLGIDYGTLGIDFLYRVIECVGSLGDIPHLVIHVVAGVDHLACRLGTPRTAWNTSYRFTRCRGVLGHVDVLIDVCPFPAASDPRTADASP